MCVHDVDHDDNEEDDHDNDDDDYNDVIPLSRQCNVCQVSKLCQLVILNLLPGTISTSTLCSPTCPRACP